MSLWCVVPAAGKGLRVGGTIPKQYLPLNGRTVMQCTLDRLCRLATEAVIVPIAADDTQANTLDYRDSALIRFVEGGDTRAASVLAGLNAIANQAADEDWVLVHDVARPCVRIEDIDLLLERIAEHPTGGLLANRVRDTMKRGVLCVHDVHSLQAIERRGEMPLLVDSARDNIKITWPEDLQIAEAILSLQHKAGL